MEIIDRCIAPVPAKRYPNAQAILNALNARALQRARRPLLIAAAVGPLLLLLLMAYGIQQELQEAARELATALTDEAKTSSPLTAQAVADNVAGHLDRRWRILEHEAVKPEFQQLLRAARGRPLGSAEQRALQNHLSNRYQARQTEVPAMRWLVLDRDGCVRACTPHQPATEALIGLSCAHRGFFTGRDRDLDEHERAPPLTQIYLSPMHLNAVTGTREVIFSAPVWDGPGTGPDHPRLGVLLMSADVRASFGELTWNDAGTEKFIAALVDLRPDFTKAGRKVALLAHPGLTRLRRQGLPEEDLDIYVDRELEPAGWYPDYSDPLAATMSAYQGRWLTAVQPVIVKEHPELGDTGWAVLVQEHYRRALEPVDQLEQKMRAQGWQALGVAAVTIVCLWLVVIVVLNESPGSRLAALLRRRAGLPANSWTPGSSAPSGRPSDAPLGNTPGGPLVLHPSPSDTGGPRGQV